MGEYDKLKHLLSAYMAARKKEIFGYPDVKYNCLDLESGKKFTINNHREERA